MAFETDIETDLFRITASLEIDKKKQPPRPSAVPAQAPAPVAEGSYYRVQDRPVIYDPPPVDRVFEVVLFGMAIIAVAAFAAPAVAAAT